MRPYSCLLRSIVDDYSVQFIRLAVLFFSASWRSRLSRPFRFIPLPFCSRVSCFSLHWTHVGKNPTLDFLTIPHNLFVSLARFSSSFRRMHVRYEILCGTCGCVARPCLCVSVNACMSVSILPLESTIVYTPHRWRYVLPCLCGCFIYFLVAIGRVFWATGGTVRERLTTSNRSSRANGSLYSRLRVRSSRDW